MKVQHASLASGRWQTLSLFEQMGNIGSEINRVSRAKNDDMRENAISRTLELFDFTISDPRWRKRLKEIVRAREVFCDAIFGGKLYNSSLADLDKYFMQFAIAARLKS